MGRTKGKQGSSKQRKQRGYVLVTVGMAMVALIGFAALAIDVGYLYSKRANYQRAADAAALAGAFTFVVEPKSAQPDTATAHAIAVATTNSAMGTAITPDQVTVTFPPAPISGTHLVTVTINASSQTFFAALSAFGCGLAGRRGTSYSTRFLPLQAH